MEKDERRPYWLSSIHLDRQVVVKAVFTGTVTYWQLPFPDLTMDTVIHGDFSTLLEVPLMIHKPDPLRQAKDGNGQVLPDILVADGDYTQAGASTCHIVGRRYLFMVEPTRPYARNGAGEADVIDRLWIGNLTVRHRQTGSYVMRNRRPALYRDNGSVRVPKIDRTVRFNHRLAGVNHEGNQTHWAGGEADVFCNRLEDETPRPTRIVGLDWLLDHVEKRLSQ